MECFQKYRPSVLKVSPYQPSFGFGLFENCWFEFVEADFKNLVVVSTEKNCPVRCVVVGFGLHSEQEEILVG